MKKKKSLKIFGGLFFVFGALLCGLIGLVASIRTVNKVEKLTPIAVVVLEDTQPGNEVLMEGRISNQNPVQDQSTGFVTYLIERREIYYDEEGEPDPGSWYLSQRLTPPLLVELPDGLVQIANDDYELENALVIDQRLSGQSFDEYDTRYKGLQVGESVVVVGVTRERDEIPRIEADFIARGTRESYLSRQRNAGIFFCIGSVVVAIIGGIILSWDRLRRR